MTSRQKLHLNILAVITFCLLVIGWMTDHGGPLMVAATVFFIIHLTARFAPRKSQ